MKTYIVKHNFAASQPNWGAKNIALFGTSNTGFTITGETPKEAITNWNKSQLPGNRLNPFYLTITEAVEVNPDNFRTLAI